MLKGGGNRFLSLLWFRLAPCASFADVQERGIQSVTKKCLKIQLSPEVCGFLYINVGFLLSRPHTPHKTRGKSGMASSGNGSRFLTGTKSGTHYSLF